MAEAGAGRILMLEGVADGEWTLVSSTTANGGGIIGDIEDGAEVRDVIDMGGSGHRQWADWTLGGGLRSPSISTSDLRETSIQHDKDLLAAIVDCTDNLRVLRDEKEGCRTSLDNTAQAITDQANASQVTMDQLFDLKRDADPMLRTIEEQIMKDLGHQLEIDRHSLSQKTSSLRGLSAAVRSLEADISAEEARLAGLLSTTIICTGL